eukprot:1160971-Pelagomonas_calceolata.AAC.2
MCLNRKGRFLGRMFKAAMLSMLASSLVSSSVLLLGEQNVLTLNAGRAGFTVTTLSCMPCLGKPSIHKLHLAEPAWISYLNEHFRVSAHQQPQRPHHGCQGLSARDAAAPLGENPPPPEVFLRQDARADWIPEPDVVSATSLDTVRSLVADQIKKMNGSASPGFVETA